nr:hypothetical protein [Tanacetum cinerariifolium]
MREVEGKWIMMKEMRMILKDDTISEFPVYTSSKEEEEEKDEEKEEEEENEVSEKKRSKKASEMESNSKPSGYTAIDNEVESDLKSTARSEPKCREMEDTCERGSTLVKGGIYNYMRHNTSGLASMITWINVDTLYVGYTCMYMIVTQVTDNVKNANANGGNGGNGNGGITTKIMSSSNYPFIVPSDSDIEDAFSSTNTLDYTPASPDYFPASLGNIPPDSSNDLTKDLLASLAFSPFHDDPYMKVMQAYNITNNELPIPPQAPIAPQIILPQSPMTSTLEMIIEDIQVRHRSDKKDLLDAIYELKNRNEGPSDY